jgi:hypothetical protein
MIGFLSSTIKSRRHPEANLVNRYLRSCATRSGSFNIDAAESSDDDAKYDGDEVADDGILVADPHPLVRLDARNSAVDADRVLWPSKNPSSQARPTPFGNTAESLVLLQAMLGAQLCAQYVGRDNSFTEMKMLKPVIVGLNKLCASEKENKKTVGLTRSCWFRMARNDMPHAAIPPQRDRGYIIPSTDAVFGCIHSFAEVHVPGWCDTAFHLAAVELYDGSDAEKYTGYPIINTSRPLRSHADNVIRYIQVKYVQALVAIAPVKWKNEQSQHLFVMPINV